MGHELGYPHTDRCLDPGDVDVAAWRVSQVTGESGALRVVGPCPACGADGQEARADATAHPVERIDLPTASALPDTIEVVVSCRCGAPHGADGADGCGAHWAFAVTEEDGAMGVIAIELSRDDVAAVADLELNERERLGTARTRTAQWLTALAASATALGTAGVLVGPPGAAELDPGVRSVVGIVMAVALAAFAGATVQAFQAAFGELGGGPELPATPVRGAGERWRAARRRAAELAVARLRLAVVLGLTGLGVAVLGALIGWFHTG